MNKNEWTTVRVLSGQAAETGVPAPASFVRLRGRGSRPRWIEFLLDGGSVAGSPTDVTFTVWALADGKVVKAGRITMSANDAAEQGAAALRVYADEVYVTVESFTGGTSPTVSGTVVARPLEYVPAEAAW